MKKAELVPAGNYECNICGYIVNEEEDEVIFCETCRFRILIADNFYCNERGSHKCKDCIK